MNFYETEIITAILVVVLLVVTLRLGIKVVPQSEVFVVERFGKFALTLNAGLSLIVLFLDRLRIVSAFWNASWTNSAYRSLPRTMSRSR